MVVAAAGFAGGVFGEEFVVVGAAVVEALLSLLSLLLTLSLLGDDGLDALTLVAVPVDDGVVLVEVRDGSVSILDSSIVCVMVTIVNTVRFQCCMLFSSR